MDVQIEKGSSESHLIFASLYQTIGCRPIASLDHFLPEYLGNAGLVEEVSVGASRVVKVGGMLCGCGL